VIRGKHLIFFFLIGTITYPEHPVIRSKRFGKGQIYRINKRVVANAIIISYVTSNY